MTACLQTWLGVLPLAYKHTSVGGSARPCESNRLFRPANELPTSRYVCPRFCKGVRHFNLLPSSRHEDIAECKQLFRGDTVCAQQAMEVG